MINRDEIQAFANQIAERFSPERIILFGSYAYGTPHEGSDADILVEMYVEGNPIDKTIEIIRTLHPKIDVDILVRTPAMIARRLTIGDPFIKAILHKGTLLYERKNA